jgi:hypothetical protein
MSPAGCFSHYSTQQAQVYLLRLILRLALSLSAKMFDKNNAGTTPLREPKGHCLIWATTQIEWPSFCEPLTSNTTDDKLKIQGNVTDAYAFGSMTTPELYASHLSRACLSTLLPTDLQAIAHEALADGEIWKKC